MSQRTRRIRDDDVTGRVRCHNFRRELQLQLFRSGNGNGKRKQRDDGTGNAHGVYVGLLFVDILI